MNYWKLRAQLSDIKLAEEKINQSIKKLDAARTLIYKEHELDINVNYDLDDKTETVKAIENESKTRT